MGEGFKATEKIVVRVDCNAVEDFSTLGLAERVRTFACLKGKGPGLSYPKSRKQKAAIFAVMLQSAQESRVSKMNLCLMNMHTHMRMHMKCRSICRCGEKYAQTLRIGMLKSERFLRELTFLPATTIRETNVTALSAAIPSCRATLASPSCKKRPGLLGSAHLQHHVNKRR